MDKNEIEKIADLIIGLFVAENYEEKPAIRYLHCGCCSVTLTTGVEITKQEMISILRSVREQLDTEITKLEKAKKNTRRLNNPEVY